MKRIITIVALSFALTIVSPALAENQDTSTTTNQATEELSLKDLGLSEPSMVPGSFWYPLKTAFEKIQQLLTFNKESAMKLDLELAGKRLAEAKKLAEKEDNEAVLKALQKYTAKVEEAKKKLDELDKKTLTEKQKERLENTKGVFTESFFKHIAVLERVKEQVPDQAKDTIAKVIEQQKEKLQERIAKLDPADAAKAKEKLDAILNKLPGDEIGKIEFLNILKEMKSKFSPTLQTKLEQIDTERAKKIAEEIKNKATDKEKQKKLLENLNAKLKRTQEKMADFQNKVLKELPQDIQTQYQEIKQQIQENTKAKDGSLDIL